MPEFDDIEAARKLLMQNGFVVLTEEWAVSEQIGENTYISPIPKDRVFLVAQRINSKRKDSAQVMSRLTFPWRAKIP